MPKILKNRWPLLLIFLVSLGLFIYFTWLVEPSSSPKNLLISNVTDGQATVSYITDVSTKGAILVSSNNKFPILPIFSKSLQKDDGEKLLPGINRYTTHHITIGNLSPAKKYYYRVYQGQKKVFEGQFATKNTQSNLVNPNPVYGRVLKTNRKPVIGAIVYLRIGKEASQSALLSTITNQTGGWSLDLANLGVSSAISEQLLVEAGSLGRVKTATDSAHDKPWPDIILSTK